MDERVWTDRPLAVGEAIEVGACRVRHEAVPALSLVSGDLDAARAALAPGAPLLGLCERADGPDFAIRISRDHAALVTRAAPALGPGWHAGGFALSRADDRYACLSVIGAGAADTLARGLASPLPASSPSAALRFAGRTVLLTGPDGGYRLWVERADLTFIGLFLATVLAD